MKIDIGSVLLAADILLAVLIIVVVIAVIIIKREFSTIVEKARIGISADIREAVGVSNFIVSVLEGFRSDFALHFNRGLAQKVEALMRMGERKENVMEIVNPETGEKEIVPIDEGY